MAAEVVPWGVKELQPGDFADGSHVLWEVDAQVDFMLPGGALYVPGAEKIIPNVKRLVDAAQDSHYPLISSADAHPPDDPEFQALRLRTA